MRFLDRVVLVTGAGSGIGAVMAADFAAEGAVVVVNDVRAEAAHQVAASIPRAVPLAVDVADGDDVRHLVAGVMDDFGSVDVLVNNAASCSDSSFEEICATDWQRDIDVTLAGAFHTSQAVLPRMVDRGGCIINIASVNGISYFGNEAYSAAKAGLLSLTRSLAVRYGPRGVRVNAVVPGTVATPAWQRRLTFDSDILGRIARWYPLGRVGAPADVSAAVLFLASDQASWITGAALPVDGGLLAGNMEMAREVVIGEG